MGVLYLEVGRRHKWYGLGGHTAHGSSIRFCTCLYNSLFHPDFQCTLDPTNPAGCHPEFQWVGKIFGNPDVKAALGVPHDLNYTALNMEVNAEFHAAGDASVIVSIFDPAKRSSSCQDSTTLSYVPAFTFSGDSASSYATCDIRDYSTDRRAQTTSAHKMLIAAGPGYSPSYVPPHPIKNNLKVEPQLRLLKTPFQEEFIAALDVPWPTKEIATVRSVGVGAGNMAFILVAEAGHFVSII
jgi:hypothetical protein